MNDLKNEKIKSPLFIMAVKQYFDLTLILQAVPSLLISLIGLSLSGKKLDNEQKSITATVYPLLLLANCILSFKGNAELIYAMHLSSLSQAKSLSSKKYFRFSFDNGCLVLAQSIIIGVSVSILGMGRNILANVNGFSFFPRILSACLLTSFASSFAIIILLIPSMLIAVKLGTNPDNIILPVISSIGDYTDICMLIFFMRKFQNASNFICILSSLTIMLTLVVLIYISTRSKRRIAIQSVPVLVISYLLSTCSSYAIQYFSQKHLVLAASYPIFCGLTGSCSYIYLNKKITSLQNNTPYNRKQLFVTLVVTSFMVATVTALLMPLFKIHFQKIFSVLFISCFVMSVGVLMKIIDFLVRVYGEDLYGIGVVALPTITSCADFLGTFFVIGMCFVVNGFSK